MFNVQCWMFFFTANCYCQLPTLSSLLPPTSYLFIQPGHCLAERIQINVPVGDMHRQNAAWIEAIEIELKGLLSRQMQGNRIPGIRV
jgi:hypothetical protein